MSTTLKAACLGTLGLVTLWSCREAKANDIISNMDISTSIPLTHEHVLYTSNASITYSPIGSFDPGDLINVGTPGSASVTPATATTGTFSASIVDPVMPTAPDGTFSFGGNYLHYLTLIGLNSDGNIVLGLQNPAAAGTLSTYLNANFATIKADLLADNDTALGSIANPNGPYASAPLKANDLGVVSYGFDLFSFSSDASLSVNDIGNGVIGPVTAAPEPASAALIGLPTLALALARRKRRA